MVAAGAPGKDLGNPHSIITLQKAVLSLCSCEASEQSFIQVLKRQHGEGLSGASGFG